MAAYWVNTPDWFKKLFPEQITLWNIKGDETPTVYITFDDGPHPDVTPFVLDVLKQYNAKATFFCVGNNVTLYPGVYNSILAGDHTTGNHTYDHKNGWKTHSSTYMLNIEKANSVIKSNVEFIKCRFRYYNFRGTMFGKCYIQYQAWQYCNIP